MPQFLSQRYNGDVAMIMAVFWLLLYVIVNLTSILYLGALAINGISGIEINLCMYGLAFFAIVIALGGMKVIGYTDVIQVVFLIFGGLVTTYLALDKVAEQLGNTRTVCKKYYVHPLMISLYENRQMEKYFVELNDIEKDDNKASLTSEEKMIMSILEKQ